MSDMPITIAHDTSSSTNPSADTTHGRPTKNVFTPPAGYPAQQEFTVTGRNNEMHTFTGHKLASATSHAPDHYQHESEFAPKRWRCSACRWFEVTVYRVTDRPNSQFVVHTRGVTIVPGEMTYSRVLYAKSAFHVMDALTPYDSRRDKIVLPVASYNVLADAAELDPDINEALQSWIDAGA